MKRYVKASSASDWIYCYRQFEAIVDKYFDAWSGDNQDKLNRKIDNEVTKLYIQHKGEPDWDEAYNRWSYDAGMDTRQHDQANEPEILYVIKDNHGNQHSSPNEDDSELWDRVASMEARGRRGLSVVVYTGK